MKTSEEPAIYRWIVRPLEWVVIGAMGTLVIDVLWGVGSRYVLGEQTRWTEELARFLLIWVSLLGAALVFYEKGHLGVDYFAGKLEEGARRLASIVAELAVLAFAAIAMVYGGWVLVSKTLQAGQVSPALGLPVGLVYLAVPLSGVLICLFSLHRLVGMARGGEAEPGANDI